MASVPPVSTVRRAVSTSERSFYTFSHLLFRMFCHCLGHRYILSLGFFSSFQASNSLILTRQLAKYAMLIWIRNSLISLVKMGSQSLNFIHLESQPPYVWTFNLPREKKTGINQVMESFLRTRSLDLHTQSVFPFSFTSEPLQCNVTMLCLDPKFAAQLELCTISNLPRRPIRHKGSWLFADFCSDHLS